MKVPVPRWQLEALAGTATPAAARNCCLLAVTTTQISKSLLRLGIHYPLVLALFIPRLLWKGETEPDMGEPSSRSVPLSIASSRSCCFL